jgi:hypothetical protein
VQGLCGDLKQGIPSSLLTSGIKEYITEENPKETKEITEEILRPRSTKFVNAKAAYFGGNFVYL